MKLFSAITILFLHSSCGYRKPIVFPNQVHPFEIKLLEEQVIRMVNEYREAAGLKPLIQSDVLNFYAKKHSRRMATKKIPFGHYGFSLRSKEIASQYQRSVKVGENVHYNNSSKLAAQIAVVKWLTSRKHLQNIEDDFILTGVGVVQSTDGGFFFTQMFLGE